MSQTSGGVPRILHVHSTFSAGGKEVRCARLMNAWGPRLHHSIISAEPQAMAAAALIHPGVPVDYPQDFPSLKGKPTPARLARLARAMQGFDLVWFGIIVVVVTEIALITPPVGMNVFVLKAVLPDVPVMRIFRGLVPFIAADLVRLGLLVGFPAISLWLVTHV